LRREVLERLGWRIHRVWSTDWIVAANQETTRVLEAVELARRVRDGLLVDEAPLALRPEDQPSGQGRSRPDAAPSGTMSPVLAQQSAVSNQQSEAATLAPTGTAGPRQPDPLSRSTGEGLGEGVVPADTVATVQVRATATRSIDAVPPSEIAEAVRAVLATAFAMPLDPLIVAVARELGYRRTGRQIKATVGRVLAQQVAAGALVEVGGSVRLPDASPPPDRPS
jgi:hypothetical protein